MGSDAGSWDINITIDAIDEATADLKKVSQGLDAVDNATENAAETTRSAGIDFTKFNQALEIGEKALQYMEQAYEALVVPTVEYAAQVRDLSRLTGMSADESSRMIQVADDLTISYETLTTALQAGVRNGIDPSVESIAALSDEYLTLEPGLERSAFLMDNFGRSGQDLAPLMERGREAILDMSDSIDANMIMTQNAVDMAREFEIATDNLSDAVEGAKYRIGTELVGAITDATNATIEYIEASRELYEREMEQYRITGELGNNWTALDRAAAEQIVTEENLQAVMDEYDESLRSVIVSTGLAYTSNEGYIQSLWNVSPSAEDAADAQDELKTALDLVNTSMGALTTQMLYQQAAAGLDAESTLALARRLGLLDENTYSALRQVQDFKAGLVDLNGDGLISAAEGAGELITKVEQINDSMVELYPGLTGVQTEMLNTSLDAFALAEDMETAAARGYSLRDSIDSIHDKDATVVVEFKAVGDVWAAGYAGYNQASYSQPLVNASTTPISSLEQYVLENFAGGVDDYIVPPGYPNDRALIGVSSGEHVSVTPNGTSGGGGVVNNYFNIYSNDPRETARQVARLLKQKGVVL